MAENSPKTLQDEAICIGDACRPSSASNSNGASEIPGETTTPNRFRKTHANENFILRDISSRIFQCIQKPAFSDNKPMKGGYIYVMRMTDSRYRDYVKIGRTTQNIHKRKSQIVYECGYQLDAVDESCFTKVSCHERLEAIIHLEFLNERHFFTCPCKSKAKKNKDMTMDAHVKDQFTTHGEWFKIDYNKALSRVQKWRDWMSREPYELGGVLAPEWEEHIEYLSRKTNYADMLRKEERSDQLWKSFMKTSEIPWIDRFVLAARRGPDGRRVASRWNSVRANWSNLILFFMAQYFVIQILEWAEKESPIHDWYMYGFLGLMNLYWL